ncbi:putative effector of murein hydrolase [Aequitasia blattaphilus]|uniref:LrgB family protein n=1 Tax=Aequitasia blattaphilus TaxID=2949332 RepID=A0ABT1E6T4_9FIRM|nr:LrgB family protein [Aequitasia blattaphilus]MCP1101545.1 LrgB family protein [Aequitasia blattaphilus]MCR8614185.1 LrgB family protein [Aequitasia blattaphilus]
MEEVFKNPLFGILITTMGFLLGVWLQKKFKNFQLNPLLNPVLIGTLFCYCILNIFGISYEDYSQGGNFLASFVLPATAVLGLSIYRQRKILKEQFIPVFLGCLVGSLVSISSAFLLGKVFNLNDKVIYSILPKSVTTAIGVDLSAQLGGNRSITILAIMVCGMMGAIFHPFIIKFLKLKDKVAIGAAFGTSSHAVGTTKALEMGEVEGAISGVSIGVAGICTVIIALFL